MTACIMCLAERCPRWRDWPEDLNVTSLLHRIGDGGVTEVILALPATVDGAPPRIG